MKWTIPPALREDADMYGIVADECNRQENNIELIASENFVSPAVLAALGSPLTNKYAEGYPGKRYYGGCQCVDKAETLAIKRAKALFGCDHANVQPHAGAQANMAAYHALLRPGDRVLGMDLNGGGHLTHGSPFNFSGRLYDCRAYGLNPDTELIDYDQLRDIAREFRPHMIIAGASAYPRVIDFKAFREICDEVGAFFMADMAHIAGLVAAGLHPSPVPYADIVTTTTHKTLRGPRGGLILCKAAYAKAVDRAVFPGVQGGPLMHVIAAKGVCLREAATAEFSDYQRRILTNAKALENALRERGVGLISGGTDNHLLLLDLRQSPFTGAQAEKWLGEAHITVNKNMVPRDRRKTSETSGIRVGTPAVTTRGLDENDMALIAHLIADVLESGQAAVPAAREAALALMARHPLYQ